MLSQLVLLHTETLRVVCTKQLQRCLISSLRRKSIPHSHLLPFRRIFANQSRKCSPKKSPQNPGEVEKASEVNAAIENWLEPSHVTSEKKIICGVNAVPTGGSGGGLIMVFVNLRKVFC